MPVSTEFCFPRQISLVTSGSVNLPPNSGPIYPADQIISSQPSVISLSQPAYLIKTAIPGLDTKIIRITEQNAATFGTGQRYYRHYYSKQQPWNADNTKICLSHNSGRVYFIHGTTYAYQSQSANVPEYPKWSSSDPDKMYGCTGTIFQSYKPSTNTKTTIHDYSAEFSTLYLGIGEGNLSNDGRYVPLAGNYASASPTFIVWDTVNNVEYSRVVLSGGDADWISMSQSGNYVIINKGGVFKVYDTSLNFLRNLTAAGQGHADLGYDSSGNEVLVCALYDAAPDVKILSTRLDNNTTTVVLPSTHMASSWHMSCRNTDRPGYAYVSNFAFVTTTRYMYREVYAVKLDGSGTVERFSQDFKAELPLADLTYNRAAQAVPNRDGSKVIWASDWQDASSSALIFDYVAGVNP